MTRREWLVSAVFETQEQAKAAALAVQSIKPVAYRLVVIEDGATVWQEQGERPGVVDVRV